MSQILTYIKILKDINDKVIAIFSGDTSNKCIKTWAMTINECALILICLVSSFICYHVGFNKGSNWIKKIRSENEKIIIK